MIIKADKNICFVFDLDDTLYSEIDYLKSAYHAICNEVDSTHEEKLFTEVYNVYEEGGNAFQYLIERYQKKNLTLEKLLYLYHNHIPDISLREGVLNMILKIKEKNSSICIITDGRSVTQRNKLNSLGISCLIDDVIISEEIGYSKPSFELFRLIEEKERAEGYYYFADNINKDFLTPCKLGWSCIGILNEENIHKNNISLYSYEYLPHFFIKSFTQIEII
jgi:putative hydrolase of the HAD superfamily